MIALLRGVLLEKHPNQAIVEAGGVGYDVTIPVSTFTQLGDAGTEVRLRIHTHVREDALALYGFLTQDEKALFEKLIGVSGIGPTLAVKILSGLAAPELILAIRRGEVERLVKVPGVVSIPDQRNLLSTFRCRNAQHWVITNLCPASVPLAGFDVSLIGRFSGVPRGARTGCRRPAGRSGG
jgi:Holliday junction DNA helicase RuvA